MPGLILSVPAGELTVTDFAEIMEALTPALPLANPDETTVADAIAMLQAAGSSQAA